MSALLADSDITSILGSASAGSSAGAQFAAEQDFLAQTAMIVAEGPNTPPRSLVVAPPAGWDPSPAEAADLLALTTRRPGCAPPISARSPPRPRSCRPSGCRPGT